MLGLPHTRLHIHTYTLPENRLFCLALLPFITFKTSPSGAKNSPPGRKQCCLGFGGLGAQNFSSTAAPSATPSCFQEHSPTHQSPKCIVQCKKKHTHTNAFFPYKKIAEPEGDTPHLASQGSCSSSSCCRRASYPLHHISRHLARCEDSHFILLPILRATIGRQCRRILCVCVFFAFPWTKHTHAWTHVHRYLLLPAPL